VNQDSAKVAPIDSGCEHCRAPIGACKVYAHARVFCSMACADAWETDPANVGAVAASHRAANCSGYLECVRRDLMRDVYPARAVFAACEAHCPLRESSGSENRS